MNNDQPTSAEQLRKKHADGETKVSRAWERFKELVAREDVVRQHELTEWDDLGSPVG